MKVPVDNTSGGRSLRKAKRKKDKQCKQEKKRLNEVSLNPTMCPSYPATASGLATLWFDQTILQLD